jgi:tetratricopeptide (TPR) repeat protein
MRPIETERWEETTGKPRRAESYSVTILPPPPASAKGPPRAPTVSLTPVPPGALANEARFITLVVKARLRLAVSPPDWPEGRDKPAAEFFDGAPWLMDPADLPPVEVEIEAVYERHAEDGAAPRPAVKPAVGDLGAAPGGEARPLATIDPAAALAKAETALTNGNALDAEREARRAILGDPDRAAAWSALADAALARSRPEDAISLATRATALDERDARATIVQAEAELALGRIAAAKQSLARAQGLGDALKGELLERSKKLAEALGQ